METLRVDSLVGPRRAELRLAGTILVCRRSSWAGERTSYVPVEWVEVEPGSRRDVRVLLATGMALLLSIALMVGAAQLGGNGLTGAPACGFFALPLGVAAVGLGLWLRRRPTVRLLAAEEPLVEFLRKPGAQEEFLADLKRLRGRIDELQPFPAQSTFSQSTARPGAVLAAQTWLFAMPALLLEEPRLFLLAPLPALLRLGRWLLDLDKPKEVRRAGRLLQRGRGEEAARLLGSATDPDDPTVLVLLVHAHVLLGRFDEGFAACARLEGSDPELALELQQLVWTAKRTHERMAAGT